MKPMAEIVNLRLARQRRRRADKAEEATAKRLLHGRSSGEKAKARLTRGLEQNRLDGHRRDPSKGRDGKA